MDMGDGGFRPAFNVEFATTCEEQLIVGMDVVTAGSAAGTGLLRALHAAGESSM